MYNSLDIVYDILREAPQGMKREEVEEKVQPRITAADARDAIQKWFEFGALEEKVVLSRFAHHAFSQPQRECIHP